MRYIWRKSYTYSKARCVDQEVLEKNMIGLVFLLPFNCFVASWRKEATNVDNIIMLSKLFQALFIPNTTNSYWKSWFKENCGELICKINDYANSKTQIDVDRDSISVHIGVDGSLLIDQLSNEWKELKGYVSPEGFQLIQMHMMEETDLKKKALLIIREIYNLRVNTFNENQSYLQKMAQMKMRMKDLYEERRYLRQLLGEDNEEAACEQQPE